MAARRCGTGFLQLRPRPSRPGIRSRARGGRVGLPAPPLPCPHLMLAASPDTLWCWLAWVMLAALEEAGFVGPRGGQGLRAHSTPTTARPRSLQRSKRQKRSRNNQVPLSAWGLTLTLTLSAWEQQEPARYAAVSTAVAWDE